jgi:formate-dependent nitrite reductase cytochrome c552 subunit
MKKSVLAAVVLGILALFAMSCDREITGDVQLASNASASCFDCHSDQDFDLVQAQVEFRHSIHNSGDNTNRNRLYESYYQACERCHTSEGFVAYVTGVPAEGNHFSAFTCFTCHTPHSKGSLEVRVTSAVSLENGATFDREWANLCATCHHSRANVGTYVVDDVELSTHWGPHHSGQSDMLIGTNGYEYTGYNYVDSWHSTGVTEACIACHMSPSLHETIGGHSWSMHNEDRGFENIYGCNADGCHDTNPLDSLNRVVADFNGDGNTQGVQTEIEHMLDSLTVLLQNANLLTMDAEPEPVERTVATADSAGALFNWLFVEEDRSEGVHNTMYAVGLLESAINFLNTGDPNGAPGGGSYADRGRMLTAH